MLRADSIELSFNGFKILQDIYLGSAEKLKSSKLAFQKRSGTYNDSIGL